MSRTFSAVCIQLLRCQPGEGTARGEGSGCHCERLSPARHAARALALTASFPPAAHRRRKQASRKAPCVAVPGTAGEGLAAAAAPSLSGEGGAAAAAAPLEAEGAEKEAEAAGQASGQVPGLEPPAEEAALFALPVDLWAEVLNAVGTSRCAPPPSLPPLFSLPNLRKARSALYFIPNDSC